jgi:hypothetical protein
MMIGTHQRIRIAPGYASGEPLPAEGHDFGVPRPWWRSRVPSAKHEAIVALFRNRPELAPELLRDALAVDVPPYAEARIESADFTQAHAVEFRADLVVLLLDGKPVLAIVVEVQLERDDDQRWSWPVYGALARSQHRCPSVVLVFAPRRGVAAWASEPIMQGPGSVYRPLVVGPEAVPIVRDVEIARQAPELAVLSATAHGVTQRSAPRSRLPRPSQARASPMIAPSYTGTRSSRR